MVYCYERMSIASIYMWYESFEAGGTSMLLKAGPCAPCRQMDEIVQNTCATFVTNDDFYIQEKTVQLASILKSSAVPIMKELVYSRMYVHWVPCLLASEQKLKHIEMCSLWTEHLEEKPHYFENLIQRMKCGYTRKIPN